MIRRRWALAGALVLLAGWLGSIALRAEGDVGRMVCLLGDSACRSGLPGLAAHAYLLSADWDRRQLHARATPASDPAHQQLLQRLISARLAAARTLLEVGEIAAAERVALEAARADYEHVEARAMLLETRLHGQRAASARRDLMRLLLREEHPQVLSLLAEAFIADERFEDAAHTLQRALQLDENHFPSRLAMVKLHQAQRDRAAALAALPAALATAQTAAQRQQVVAWQQTLQAGPTNWLIPLRHWFYDHWVTLLAGFAYLLFLFSPAWLRLCRRLAPTPPPPSPISGKCPD